MSKINTKDEFISCVDCSGTGSTETLNCISGTASNCCASCYVAEQCETCGGAGKIENFNIK